MQPGARPGTPTLHESTSSERTSALLVSALAAFLTPFLGSSLNVALPSIGREFSMDAILLGWVPTAYLLSAAILVVPFGRIADIHGRKLVFSWGISVLSAGCALAAVAGDGWILIGARALQGGGGAMIFATGMAILTSVYPRELRGRVLGINVAAVYAGLSLGPFVGGLLTETTGWRSIFWMSGALGAAMLLIVLLKLKGEWAEARGAHLDLPGGVLYAASLTGLMYGLSRLPDATGVAILLVGLVMLLAFIRWETRISSPLLDMTLFVSNRVFAFSNLAALINYSATFAVGFLLSLYLQYLRGFTPQEAGLVLIAQPVVMAVASPFAGVLSDRIEPRIVASTGMGLIVVGLATLVFLTAATPLPMLLVTLAVLGMGFALFSSPNTNAVMSSIERHQYGVAAGTIATMRMSGQMLSIGIAMLVFALVIGPVPITPQVYAPFLQSISIAFGIFAILCLGGVFASLARGRLR
jgi:MFS family permease